LHCFSYSSFLKTEFELQGLALANKALYHLSNTPSPFGFSLVFKWSLMIFTQSKHQTAMLLFKNPILMEVQVCNTVPSLFSLFY
jgi:hypothetical protein